MRALLFWLLFNPLAVLLFLLGLGIANLWRIRRKARLLDGRRPPGRLALFVVTVTYMVLVLFSTPAFVYFLRGLLEWPYAPLQGRPEDIEAIVVLSSSLEHGEGSHGHFILDEHSRSRCDCATKMYRAGKRCPVLVSGGSAAPNEPACAVVMRDYLVRHGVAAEDMIVEDKSTDTYENAVECRRLLEERGFHKILLVTDCSHLIRAVRCFRRQGIETVGCGCHYLSTPDNPGRLAFWPDPKALQTLPEVVYEWLALVWYGLRGRI